MQLSLKTAKLSALLFVLASTALTVTHAPTTLAQDHSEHAGHGGHTMDQAMYDALRAKVPLYENYTNEQIDFSMVMMGPNYAAYVSDETVSAGTGVLVLAHGFGEVGDRVFQESLEGMAQVFPTSVGFGMSMMQSDHIQSGINRLTSAGAEKIIVVPALSSPWNTQMRQWEYMFGIHDNAGYLETPRIETEAEVVYTDTLSDDPLVAEMILDHALELSTDPSNETVIIASHGPTAKEDNDATLDMLARLGELVRQDGNFSEVKGISLQNDAPKPIRAANVETLRSWVANANAAGKSVLVVTNLLATRTIQNQIRDDLEGLDFQFNAKGMSQHPNFVKWIQETVRRNM